jgi:predicted nucleotidyltransferase
LSDVDVAVVTDEELLPRERLRLELTLETALAAISGGDFDVRIINDAPLAVKGTVVQSGTLLYARDEAVRVEFEAMVRDLYFDFLPVVHYHRRAYFTTQRAALRERGLL